MRRGYCVVLLAAGFLFGDLGCSSKSDREGGDDGAEGYVPGQPLAEEQYAAEFETAMCDTQERCCEMPRAQCQMAVQLLLGLMLPEADAPVEYDAQAASDCIGQIRDVDCATAGETPACSQVYRGTIAPGEACDSDVLDVVYSVCMAPEGGEASCHPLDGICVVEKRGVEGDSCIQTCEYVGSTESCHLYGSREGSTSTTCWREDGVSCQGGQCTLLGSLGASCAETIHCSDGLVCMEDSCAEPLPIGAECPIFGDECGDAGYCEGNSLTCTPRKDDGQPCEENEECLSEDCDIFETDTCSSVSENTIEDYCNSALL